MSHQTGQLTESSCTLIAFVRFFTSVHSYMYYQPKRIFDKKQQCSDCIQMVSHRCAFADDPTKRTLQWKIVHIGCIYLTCTIKLDFWLKAALQWLQWNGFSPVYVLWCPTKEEFFFNTIEHLQHLYKSTCFVSPACALRRCRSKPLFWLKVAEHSMHLNIFACILFWCFDQLSLHL